MRRRRSVYTRRARRNSVKRAKFAVYLALVIPPCEFRGGKDRHFAVAFLLSSEKKNPMKGLPTDGNSNFAFVGGGEHARRAYISARRAKSARPMNKWRCDP